MNGQLDLAIAEALEKVAQYGYKSDQVDLKDVMLAGFGHIAGKIEQRPAPWLQLDGKKALAAGAAVGAFIVGLAQALQVLF